MITWIFAVFSAACSSMQSTFTKFGSKASAQSGAFGFNALKTGSAFFIFVILAIGGFVFHTTTLMYAVAYALSMILSAFCGYMALMKGSMALSSLIASYSVVIPVIFGIGFLGENIYPIKIVGMVMLLSSLSMLSPKSADNKFEKSWIFYIALTFLGNGIASVIQKQHQILYPGMYIKEFTMISFGIMFAFFFVVSLIRREKAEISSVKFAVPAGLAMGGMNFLTLALSQYMDASVLFPVVCVFSTIFNYCVSSVVFKERFTNIQRLGIVLGIVSVILIK